MIGVDVASIARVKRALEREGFKMRVFTDAEREYCDGMAEPAQSYAAIFCAKEAAAKAIKTGFTNGLAPRDIEVVHEKTGAPMLVFHGAAAEIFSGYAADISLSHDGDVAIAVAELVRVGDDK